MKRNRRWMVCYQVKYSELWCADECEWVQESWCVLAPTKRSAQLKCRKEIEKAYRRVIIGKCVNARRV